MYSAHNQNVKTLAHIKSRCSLQPYKGVHTYMCISEHLVLRPCSGSGTLFHRSPLFLGWFRLASSSTFGATDQTGLFVFWCREKSIESRAAAAGKWHPCEATPCTRASTGLWGPCSTWRQPCNLATASITTTTTCSSPPASQRWGSIIPGGANSNT